MNINPLKWDTAQWQSFGRHAATAGASVVGTLVATHLVSAPMGEDIGDNINHVINGLEELAKGIVGLLAAATMAYTSLKSASNASPESKRASVSQQPDTLVVTALPGANTIELASKIAALPESHAVLSTPDVAAATPSPKVVAPAVAQGKLP